MKATRATIKAFVKKNAGKILISVRRSFDGMVDGCVESDDKGFHPAQKADHSEHTYGIAGAWFVGGGRDYITPFEKDGLRGFEVYNSCGSFSIAVRG